MYTYIYDDRTRIILRSQRQNTQTVGESRGRLHQESVFVTNQLAVRDLHTISTASCIIVFVVHLLG